MRAWVRVAAIFVGSGGKNKVDCHKSHAHSKVVKQIHTLYCTGLHVAFAYPLIWSPACLSILSFACLVICLLGHLPTFLFAYSLLCLLAPSHTCSFACSIICLLAHLHTRLFIYLLLYLLARLPIRSF